MVGVFVFASAVGGYVLVLSNLILDRSPPRTAHDGISSLPRACAGPRCFAVLCIAAFCSLFYRLRAVLGGPFLLPSVFWFWLWLWF